MNIIRYEDLLNDAIYNVRCVRCSVSNYDHRTPFYRVSDDYKYMCEPCYKSLKDKIFNTFDEIYKDKVNKGLCEIIRYIMNNNY